MPTASTQVEEIDERQFASELAIVVDALCAEGPLSSDLQAAWAQLDTKEMPERVLSRQSPRCEIMDLESLVLALIGRRGQGTTAFGPRYPAMLAYQASCRLQAAGAAVVIERPMLALLHQRDAVVLSKERVRSLASQELLVTVLRGAVGVLDLLEASIYRIALNRGADEQSITAAVVRVEGDAEAAYLVTCAHGFAEDCTDHQVVEPENRLGVEIDWSAGRCDAANDIWAVRLTGYVGPALAVRNSDAPVLADVILAGYPYISDVRRHICTFHRGQIAARTTMDSGRVVLLHTASNYPGNSGGPLVDELGFLVAVSTDNFIDSTVHPASDRILRLPFHVATPLGAIEKLIAHTAAEAAPSTP